MIMIDEFQDTDKLQLSMIKSICAPDLSNLCTVGDAQQSIYGFRGADVNVFFEFCEEMSVLNPDAKKELSKNFRSHPDILKFVAKIFSQSSVFGNNFLNLTPPDGYIAPVDVFDVANTPRIQLDMIHYAKGSASEALLLSANNMATHIAELIEKGENAGDFAIILKKMANASVYAQALLDKGIECSIVSGSIFSKTQEAQLVLNLLSVAVNTQDENALFNVLVSPLFNISDDALLALTHKPAENGRFKHQPLSSGFAQMPNAAIAALTEPDAQALCLAHESLTEFISLCRRGHTSWALRNLLNQTGYLHRLEKLSVPGCSIAANLAKAISIIEDYEQSNAGIAHLRKMFEMHLQTEKETPGSLVASNSNFVQIITAHSSKGLEFPHVCIADYEGSIAKLPSFVAENVQQNTLVAAFDKLSAPDTTVNNIFKEQYAQYDFPQLDQAKTPAEIYLALSDLNLASQVSELQRLFYVSLTRAKKSIYISARAMLTKKLLDDPYSSSGQILTNNMFTALEWEISNSPVCACDFGGSAPAIVKICEFSPNDADEKDANSQTLEGESAVQTFEVKSYVQPQMPYLNPISLFREDVESYSSISNKTSKNAEGVTCEDEIFDNPFSLGLAFHKISERAIIDMNIKGTLGQLTCPNDEFVSRIASKYALTQGQISRLKAALDLWFNSNALKEFANFGNLSAEVPYMFELKNAPSPLFIEGEIDALALDENNNAMFLDYKTGGSKDENIEDLRQAHLFQAQCYAYALLEQGCKSVQAKFVRVEHKAANGIDPQIIEYNFTQEDAVTLENQLVTQAIRL
jgi:ATP-dependent exoDNAse (exonuclease V) beta subunit